MANVKESDNVWMVVFSQVSQQTDFSEHVHGHPVVTQLYLDLLHGDYRVSLLLSGLVHCRIGTWNIQVKLI